MSIKKVFICAHANFPRGGAEANYIEYLALALIESGCKAYVFSRGDNTPDDWKEAEQCYCHNDILYYNISGTYDSTLQFAREYFNEGKKTIHLLEKYQADKGDCIITYSTNYFYIREIYQYACSKGMQLITTVVEWYQPFQYRGGLLNPVYWLDNLGFEYGIPMSGKVMPISSYLEEHFQKKGCKTLCVPIMADISQNQQIVKKEIQDKICFIYSGNPFHKDAIDVILDSFCALSDAELQKIEIHFTGMSKATIAQLNNRFGKQLEQLQDVLVIHEWLTYDNLISLYKKIDFLTLFRHENKVTRANFPSKVPEMMMYGIIPVVSEVGDYTREYLTDGLDSIILKKCRIEDGKRAIQRCINLSTEKKQQMKQEAYATVVKKFDFHIWSLRIKNFIES